MGTIEKTETLSSIPNNSNLEKTYKTALIPARKSLNGPLITARQRRFYLGYGMLYLVGCLLLLLSSSPWIQTFGAGLVFPGGGFVPILFSGDSWMTLGHIALLVGSFISFFLSLLVWLLTGNMLAPIFIWLGIAVFTPTMQHNELWGGSFVLIPGFPLAMAMVWWNYRRKALVKGIARREERNEFLVQSKGGVESPINEKTGLPIVEELSEEDLAQMRFLLDRSLQPIADFGGFDIIDQFQTASLRYQVANISYALSLANYCRMPALRGYLAQAQVNLIEKMKEPIIWRYWRLENAWGNLRFDGDPMAPDTDDNIMYSGWYAGMIAMYQSTTGDRRYNIPGSITLNTPEGKEYRYDYPTIVDNACRSLKRSPFSLYPCEPNWIYPTCNNYGPMAIRVEDRLNGTARWEGIEARNNEMLNNEFTQVDGRLDVVRSTRIGFAPPVSGLGGEMYASLFMHASSPAVARRGWEIVRRELLLKENMSDFFVNLDQYDFGNYRRAPTAYAPLAACAVEMGDYDVAKSLLEEYNELNPATLEDGIYYRKNASANHHALECIARVCRVNGIKDCVEKGMPDEWLKGPLLEGVSYPELLVAKAVSDGENLEAVFYPGGEAGIFNITISQLTPLSPYQCNGAATQVIHTDHTGRARLTVKVDGRSPLTIKAM
ncbi:MAG: hypothetical protein KUG73_16250 [Pseudomonadales bacterium]|nr:hypothetical protein [Pseudomonadales bacterium]